jgi:hypothetical protein
MGISPPLLPHIFELFIQDERSLDRSQGGLGIGLSLVRRLAEMHGGSVWAYSEGPGQGSEFVVRLPALPAAPEEERQALPDLLQPAARSAATRRTWLTMVPPPSRWRGSIDRR